MPKEKTLIYLAKLTAAVEALSAFATVAVLRSDNNAAARLELSLALVPEFEFGDANLRCDRSVKRDGLKQARRRLRLKRTASVNS